MYTVHCSKIPSAGHCCFLVLFDDIMVYLLFTKLPKKGWIINKQALLLSQRAKNGAKVSVKYNKKQPYTRVKWWKVVFLFNNYSPKAQWLLSPNNPQDEVENLFHNIHSALCSGLNNRDIKDWNIKTETQLLLHTLMQPYIFNKLTRKSIVNQFAHHRVRR